MTPEQQAVLDKLKRVLDPTTYEQIKLILLAIWAGKFAAAGYGEWVAKLLLEWAARQGTWMWLTIKDALGLVGGEAAAAETWAEWGASLGSSVVLALLPLVLLVTGGLMLPASKGATGWELFSDPCEDAFSEIADDYATYSGMSADFPKNATRASTMDLLTRASGLINECDRFLRKCPTSQRAQYVRRIREKAEKGRDDYLDWLLKH